MLGFHENYSFSALGGNFLTARVSTILATSECCSSEFAIGNEYCFATNNS